MSLTNRSAAVKRSYQSDRRDAQARATRAAILDAAAALFAERGYVATSFDSVAAEAGVSRATVFAHFPTKAVLLKAAYDVTLVGDDEPVPLPERPASLRVRAEPDPALYLAGYAAVVTDVYRRLSPIYEAIRGAAHADVEAANVWRAIGAERRIGGGNVVSGVVGRGALRDDVGPDPAADVGYPPVRPRPFPPLVRGGGRGPQ